MLTFTVTECFVKRKTTKKFRPSSKIAIKQEERRSNKAPVY